VLLQVVGFIEPLPAKEDGSPATGVEFENHIVGSAIPSNFIPSVEKGFREAATTGAVIGYPMEVRTLFSQMLQGVVMLAIVSGRLMQCKLVLLKARAALKQEQPCSGWCRSCVCAEHLCCCVS
jgi:Elongation factor G, domain IV